MSDFRTEIREAFEVEQAAFPPPAGLPAQIVASVNSYARAVTPARQRADRNVTWLMVAAAAVLVIAIVAGLVAVRFSGLHPSPANPGPAPQRCLPGPVDPSNLFASVHGCITYSDGTQIVAVDPNHPNNRTVLGQSDGRLPMAWSRDGTRLLVMEQSFSGAARADVYLINADGSQVKLTQGDAFLWEGSFSPDGTEVVYVNFTASSGGVYVVDVRSLTRQLIAADSPKCTSSVCNGQSSQFPVWSPDGSRIAYVDNRSDLARDEIWTMSINGTNKRRLVDLGKCAGMTDGSGCTNGLAWSPDGSRLAFHSPSGIYVMRADGSGLHRISTDGDQPTWSPDGSRIAFTRGGELFTMASDGGDVTLLQGVVVVPNYAWTWNPVA
jgi:Tol biopolymer transport system component